MAAVVVYAPSLLVSVTIELGPTGADELHVHPAGQGYWVARMLGVLGSEPVLCCTAAGETGAVARSRADDRIRLRVVETSGTAGSYVDDRRGGDRMRLAEAHTTPIDRHAIDDLGAVTVAEAISAGVVVLTGTNLHGTVHDAVFERLAHNLSALGVTVVADLSGDELAAVRRGGVDVIKVSHEELLDAGLAEAEDRAAYAVGAGRLQRESGADVYVTCPDGVLATTSKGRWWAHGPTFTATESRGAGDSFTAAIAHSIATGASADDGLRLAVATAASNVLRHGLGSGEAELVHAIATTVQLEELEG